MRRGAWNAARRLARASEARRGRGRPRKDAPARPASERAKALKGARYALWKNPEDLTEGQQAKLAWIAVSDPTVHRAYLRVAFGFHSASALIALAMLSLGGHRPTLPGRK